MNDRAQLWFCKYEIRTTRLFLRARVRARVTILCTVNLFRASCSLRALHSCIFVRTDIGTLIQVIDQITRNLSNLNNSSNRKC